MLSVRQSLFVLFAFIMSQLPALANESPKPITSPSAAIETKLLPDFEFVAEKLTAHQAKPEFIKTLRKTFDASIQEKVIRTNVLGFRLKPDYSGHIDDMAISKCRSFIRAHALTFNQAFKKYQVPKEIISALLWVETRHGKRTGKFPLPSVFSSIVLANHPAMIEMSLQALQQDVPATDPQYPQMVEKVKAASARKSEWAINELLAIQEMRTKHLANPFKIKGSYAGAFGMPQFLPSSYLKWAEGFSTKAKPDLFKPSDAIRSVARYLSLHGWGKEQALQKQALHEYNHSDAYVSTIITLAEKVGPTLVPHIAQE